MSSTIIPDNALELLNINDNKKLKQFYAKWSVYASKLIQQYAKDHSIEWYNTRWKNKSKEIFFYIRTKAPKTFIGNIWFASKPTNYVYAKSAEKFSATRKAIPKKFKVKPVNYNSRWFTPKKYSPNVTNVDTTISNINEGPKRFFVSKTSHNKTHKYKKPMLWYQNTDTKEIGPVTLKEQLSDKIANDPETYKLIMEAFEKTIADFT